MASSSNSPETPKDTRPSSTFSYKRRFIPILTNISHVSGAFISTFLAVHLTAPILATIGGSSLSSSVMLLGREFYQGTISEPWLLFAPLGVHIAAGVSKRLLSDQPIPRRPQLLTLAAYPLIGFLCIHVLNHRLYPMSPGPPIYSLSPSELDYEFVKYGLTKWPIRSWILYGGLVSTAIIHLVEGWQIIHSSRTWLRWEGFSRKTRKIISGIGIGLVLSGLFCLAREPLFALPATLARIDSSYQNSTLYR